jgi:hypothetical protein
MAEQRRRHGSHRQRAERQNRGDEARVKSGITERELLQERQEKAGGTQADAADGSADHADMKSADAKDLEIDGRIWVPSGVEAIGGKAQRGERDDAGLGRMRGEMTSEAFDRQLERGEADAAQDETQEVEAGCRLAAKIIEIAQGQQQARRAERHVDVKNPAPRHIGGEKAADQRTDRRTRHGRDGDIGHRRDQLGFGKGFEQYQPADRRHHRAADALQNAGQQQHR